MSSSDVKIRVAASEPSAAQDSVKLESRKAGAVDRVAPRSEESLVQPDLPQPPWHVRNFRMLMIALLLVATAALGYGYVYLQRNFGPSPLDGVKLDAIKFDSSLSVPEDTVASGSKSPASKFNLPAAPSATPAPTLPTTLPLAARKVPATDIRATVASGAATAPSGPAAGSARAAVTHTRPVATTPVAPDSDGQKSTHGPRASSRPDQSGSVACTEAVAALGLCRSNDR